MNHQNQKGFVLLVAIGILMGLLSIITALVTFQQKNRSQGNEGNQDILVDATVRSIKNTIRNNSTLLSANDKTNGVKSWMFPTMKDLPIRLSLSQDLTTGASSIKVNDLRKLFFNLMSSRYIYYNGGDYYPRKLVLGADINLGETQIQIRDFVDNNRYPENIHENIGGYIMVGSELMVLVSHNGSGTYTVENRDPSNGGYAFGGVFNRHSAGEPVFVLHEVEQSGSNVPIRGYMKINSNWFYVGVSEFDPEPTFQIYQYGTSSSTSQSINEITRSETVLADSVVEFYPFDLGFYEFDTSWNLNFSYSVVDEYSKININSMTQSIANEYLFGQAGLYMGALNDVDTYGLFPMKTVNEILITGSSATNKELILKGYNIYKDEMTVYSKPNYLSHYLDDLSLDIDERVYFDFPNDLEDVSLQNFQYRNTDRNSWAADTQTSSIILPHSVNFNTANFSVISKVLENIGTISEAEAKELAGKIIRYRSGLKYDDYTNDEQMLTNINYNGYVNPFDGVNDDTNDDGAPDASTAKTYASAEAEFLDFIYSNDIATLSDDNYDLLMAYVYKDVDAISLNKPNAKSSFITFYAGEVETHKFNLSMSIASQPVVSIKEETVRENLPTFTDFGEKISDLGDPETTGNVVLDYINGWNENQSIFYGVNFNQPNVVFNGANLLVTENADIINNSTNTITHLYPSLVGYFGENYSSKVTIDSLQGYYDIGGNEFERDFAANGDNFTGTLNFGMRIKGTNIFKNFNLDTVGDVAWSGDGVTGGGCLQIINQNSFTDVETGDDIDLDDWRDMIDNGTKVIIRHNFIEYEVTGYINDFLELDPQPAFSSLDVIAANEKFLFSTGCREDLYNYVANGKAFYETVVHRPNAVFTKISWDDNESVLNNSSSMNVSVMELDGDAVTGNLSQPNEYDITTELNAIRVRFTFRNANQAVIGGKFPTPQLYRVVFHYEIDGNEGASDFVYNRK